METNIEWADATWNPVIGCSPVSPGCLNCYAATMARRLEGMGKSGYQPRHAYVANGNRSATLRIAEVRGGRAVFTGDVRLMPDRLGEPLRWRKPRRIFVCSMSDLFHESVPFEFIDRVFAVAALCSHHQFLILTKRPERMAEYLHHQDPCRIGSVANGIALETPQRWANAVASHGLSTAVPFPLPNVWLGTSVEDQQRADERIPHLLRCPAAVRWLSVEPLLGPVDLLRVPNTSPPMPGCPNGAPSRRIDWVVVGGESGPKARICGIEWIRSIVEQCRAASVPCFVKQIGSLPVSDKRLPMMANFSNGDKARRWPSLDRKGGDPSEWPHDLRVREFPAIETV